MGNYTFHRVSADRNYQKNNCYLPVNRVFTEVSYCIFL